MAKINDTTTFPNTAPALTDHVIGTDLSNTGNSADGEVVTFKFEAALGLLDSTGAPIRGGGWHPYNATVVGPDADGEIYDYGTDGAVTEIETPTFDAGYDYMVIFESLSFNFTDPIRFDLYGASAADYSGRQMDSFTNTLTYSGFWQIRNPGLSLRTHFSDARYISDGTLGGQAALGGVNAHRFSSADTVSKGRIQSNSGLNIDSGTVWLYRRRNYGDA